MSAGLPGLGLGGLFFIFSALLAPFPELWRTLRGRSDVASWKAIGRQLAQALAMIAAIDLTLRLTYVVLSAAGIGNPPAADEATVLPLGLIGITTGLLVLVLFTAKLAELSLRASSGLPRVPEVLPRVAPLRAAGFGAVAVAAWIALLVLGASELSPLERPRREPVARRPERAEPQQAVVKPRAQGRGGHSSAPAPIEATVNVPIRAAGTPSDTPAEGGGGGEAGAAPSPAVAAPETPPTAPPEGSPPPASPEPNGASGAAPAAEAPAGAGSRPESTGRPEGVPASEGIGPAPEPPPQAPANGLRGSK
jgi:hypothetical protein